MSCNFFFSSFSHTVGLKSQFALKCLALILSVVACIYTAQVTSKEHSTGLFSTMFFFIATK